MIINKKPKITVRGFISNNCNEFLPVILGVEEIEPLKIILSKNFVYFYYEINNERQPETYYNGKRIDIIEYRNKQNTNNYPILYIDNLIKKGYSEIIQFDNHIIGCGENDYTYEEILTPQKKR